MHTRSNIVPLEERDDATASYNHFTILMNKPVAVVNLIYSLLERSHTIYTPDLYC